MAFHLWPKRMWILKRTTNRKYAVKSGLVFRSDVLHLPWQHSPPSFVLILMVVLSKVVVKKPSSSTSPEKVSGSSVTGVVVVVGWVVVVVVVVGSVVVVVVVVGSVVVVVVVAVVEVVGAIVGWVTKTVSVVENKRIYFRKWALRLKKMHVSCMCILYVVTVKSMSAVVI